MSDNKVQILYGENDKKNENTENKATFIFGVPTSKLPCIPKQSSSNTITNTYTPITSDNNLSPKYCPESICIPCHTNDNNFKVGCDSSQLKNNINDFNINCDTNNTTTNPIFDVTTSQFGYSSSIQFTNDLPTFTSQFGNSVSCNDIRVVNLRFDGNSSFGDSFDCDLYTTRYIDGTSSFGYDTPTNITYNPYTVLVDNSNPVNSYFGVNANTYINFNPYNNLTDNSNIISGYFGVNTNTYINFNPYTILIDNDNPVNSYYGVGSNSNITYNPYTVLCDSNNTTNGYFGSTSNSDITYNPYNNFLGTDNNISSTFGFDSNTAIIYNKPNPLDAFNGYVGFDSNTYINFNPYTILIDGNNPTTSYFGINSSSIIAYNPYNDISKDNNISTSIGIECDVFINFNPYTVLPNPNTISFDLLSTTFDLRYDDDHRIDPNGTEYPFGYDLETDIQFGDNHLEVVTENPFGYSSDITIQYNDGFIGTSNFGISGRLYTFSIGNTTPYLNDIVGGFGFSLSNNHNRTRYFDLSVDTCCRESRKRELLNFELTATEDYDVIYGIQNAWDSFGSTAMLTTQPRFKATSSFGIQATVKDNSVYFETTQCYFGFNNYSRGLQSITNINLGYGNFIQDQNNIIIELSQDDSVPFIEYDMYVGATSITLFNITPSLPYNIIPIGFYANNFDLYIERPFDPNAYFNIGGEYVPLSTNDTLPTNHYIGFTSMFTFFEPNRYMYVGFSSVSTLSSGAFGVELQEEGELVNEYIFTNKNGDPILSKPSEVSIEGYPYKHKIKGHCY